MGGIVGIYYEVVVVIVVLVFVGQVLELWVWECIGDVIWVLMDFVFKIVWCILFDGMEYDVLLENIMVGDFLCVWLGDSVLVDSEVVEGCFFVDESMIMGELVLVEKVQGDRVIGGMINKNGMLVICVIDVGVDMVLLQIVQMVVGV